MRGGSLSFIFPPPPSRKRIGRTSGIVRDETRSGRVWRTLSFSACLPSCYFFFDMQAFSSPPPAVRLFHELQWEAGVTTAIQFPYEQLPCRQGWQFIYFNLTDWENHAHQSSQPSHCIQGTRHRRGDWWAWSISLGSSCSGLNMLTPLKLARDPSSE